MALLKKLTFYIIHDGIVARQMEFLMPCLKDREQSFSWWLWRQWAVTPSRHTCTCTPHENIWCKWMWTTAVSGEVLGLYPIYTTQNNHASMV